MKKSSAKLLGLFAASGLLLVIVILVSLVVYRAYYQTSDSGFTRVVAKTFNLPAARVGSVSVSYDDFLLTRDAVWRFLNSDAGKALGGDVPPAKEVDKNILEQLIRQAMVKEIAAERDLSVLDDDVRAVFADVVAAAASSTTPDVAQYLWENYGWNEEDFRVKVLRPALLEQKVAVTMAQEAEGDQMALEYALMARREEPDVIVYLHF